MEICSLSMFFFLSLTLKDTAGCSIPHVSLLQQTQHKYRSYRNWNDSRTGRNLPLTSFILCCKHAINFSPWLLPERILHGFRAHLSVSEAFSLRKVFDFKYGLPGLLICSVQLNVASVKSSLVTQFQGCRADSRHQIVPVAAFNATRANSGIQTIHCVSNQHRHSKNHIRMRPAGGVHTWLKTVFFKKHTKVTLQMRNLGGGHQQLVLRDLSATCTRR